MSTEGSTTVVTGTLGGGKSLCGVELAMEHLSKGGTVVTNIPVYPDKIRQWMKEEYGLIFDPARLVLLKQASIRDFQDHAIRGNEKTTTLMLLDEAALDLGARDWKTQSDEQFNFVVLCRKLRVDLVLIAQDANDVDKRIRQKMQNELYCKSLKNFWELFPLPVFLRVRYTIELGKKPWRRGITWHWKGRAWGYFDSMALHGEKACLFGALATADASDLQRVTYPLWPYLCAAGTASVTSSATILWLLAN